jgi:hypothetical protein
MTDLLEAEPLIVEQLKLIAQFQGRVYPLDDMRDAQPSTAHSPSCFVMFYKAQNGAHAGGTSQKIVLLFDVVIAVRDARQTRLASGRQETGAGVLMWMVSKQLNGWRPNRLHDRLILAADSQPRTEFNGFNLYPLRYQTGRVVS